MRSGTRRRRLTLPALTAILLAASPAGAQPWPAAPPPSPWAEPLPPPPPPPAVPHAGFRPSLGGASIVFTAAGGRQVRQDGVALQLRLREPVSERVDANVSVTWGLTDWERAKEWVDAGNASGAWTTEKIDSVAGWVGEGGDSQPIRLFAAIFAELFLVATYAAVPVCYVGSVGGATSHLQLDATATAHVTRGPVDVWAEGGVGVATLPQRFVQWDYALGPVVGLGVDFGPLRVGGRVLWSPGGLNSSERGERSVTTASLTVGSRD